MGTNVVRLTVNSAEELRGRVDQWLDTMALEDEFVVNSVEVARGLTLTIRYTGFDGAQVVVVYTVAKESR